MSDAFYELRGDHFHPTELTRGPWDREHQHAGPPAALIARALEHHDPRPHAQFARMTFELLRPIPIAPLRIEVETRRGGRRVELLEARLHDADGEVVRASAWRLRTTEVNFELPPSAPHDESPPGPTHGRPGNFFPTGESVGYHTGMEYSFITGDFVDPGPATVWMRMRIPLIAGEEPTPLQRLLIAADSGNGVSSALDYRRYIFVNVELTVHLHRLPRGEWVCLNAVTLPERSGIGVSDARLYDEEGPLGRALQALLVADREV